MDYYKIKDISQMTGLSIRSLQYYDEVGLLKPTQRSESGYRLYSKEDLIRLQQVVTLKFLGFSLNSIKEALGSVDFEVLASLRLQAQALKEKADRIQEASNLTTYIASQIEAGQPINWNSTLQIIHILETQHMIKTLEKHYQTNPEQSELGQVSSHDPHYNPERLFAIPRAVKRTEIGIDPNKLPFYGFDYWNHYEVSWLNEKGKPMVAVAEIVYDCTTPYLVESKSLKLYFNSFNNTPFKSIDALKQTIEQDLSKCVNGEVGVRIISLSEKDLSNIESAFTGECIDALDVSCTIYLVEPNYLTVGQEIVEEQLYSDLLKSNCLVTHQPDWGSVQITYKGPKINREGLLKYLVSFRDHNEFHEQCIERIFVDILQRCKPIELSVYGRYTRRGGLDINPYRSTSKAKPLSLNQRLVRQ